MPFSSIRSFVNLHIIRLTSISNPSFRVSDILIRPLQILYELKEPEFLVMVNISMWFYWIFISLSTLGKPVFRSFAHISIVFLFSCFGVVLSHYKCVILTPNQMYSLQVWFLFYLSLLVISLGRGSFYDRYKMINQFQNLCITIFLPQVYNRQTQKPYHLFFLPS